jgi:virginiamycin B lyase
MEIVLRKSPRRIGAAIVVLVVLAALVLAWQLGVVSGKVAVVEFPMQEGYDTPTAIAVAGDGTVWFTIDLANAIGRIRNGKLERLPEPGTNLEPIGLAITDDGAAWYPDAAARQIQRVAPDGKITSLTLETPVAKLGKIAAAPDGSVWFAESSMYSITRLKDGKLTRHVIESVRGGPYGVAVGADGTVWATLQNANQLLRITPDGQMKPFDVPTRGSSPTDVAIGQDGSVWFVEFRGNKVVRFRDSRFEEISLGTENVGATGLAVAPNGDVWFGMLRKRALGRVREGKLKEFSLPRKTSRPYGVALDGEGNVWYTDINGYVGKLSADQARR